MKQLINIKDVHMPTYEDIEKNREKYIGKLKSALPIMRLYSINGYYFNKEELSDYLRKNREGQFLIIDYVDSFDGRNNAFKITYPDGQIVVKVAINKDIYEVFSFNFDTKMYNWFTVLGNINDIYQAFEKRGIVIEQDSKLVRKLN